MSGTYADDAPVLMVLSANESLYHARYNQPDKLAITGGVEITWPVPYWFVDAGALMMLVLMAAIDEGLASAFIGHPDQKRICDDVLGLPDDVVPIGLALIGKPGDDPAPSSRLKEMRRPADDLIHWQRW
jgi:nitroreductase